jgi:hypothetical protein
MYYYALYAIYTRLVEEIIRRAIQDIHYTVIQYNYTVYSVSVTMYNYALYAPP